jgi:hypothetical protein
VKRTPLARRTRLARTPIKKRGRGHRYAISGVPDMNYREWIRMQPCLVNKGLPCRVNGLRHPHHVKTRGAGGKDAQNLVPLCVVHHQELHDTGRTSFETKYGLDLRVHAERLWAHHQTQEAR